MSEHTTTPLTRNERRRLDTAATKLDRFADGIEVRATPASIRVGYSKAEWPALRPEDRRTYIRAVLDTRARLTKQAP